MAKYLRLKFINGICVGLPEVIHKEVAINALVKVYTIPALLDSGEKLRCGGHLYWKEKEQNERVDEESCYNCAHCETFDNGRIRCTNIPKGVTEPCPYFLRRSIPDKNKEPKIIQYRGIETLYRNI